MKKKILAYLLAFCLIFTSVGYMAPVHAQAASLPKKGTTYSGFAVTKSTYDDATKTQNILFTHTKTGAKMLVIKNEDKNRGFAIGFNTPSKDDTGINHILEHAMLGGSEKYPLKDIIFNVTNTTYTSFINAMTYQNMTMYPVCSESEKQLMKLTDVYMDAVYHPLVIKDKKVFEREAWRYELPDADSKLTINGIVYNEMRGNYGNMQTMALLNAKKALFANSNQGNIAGGDPSVIPDLSYKKFVATYKENYHPSNSMMVLYGDVNYKSFLKMLNNDYLSDYKKKTFKIDHSIQKPYSKLVQKTYDFPAAKDAVTENASIIDVAFALPDQKTLGSTKISGIYLAASLLATTTSDFYQNLQKSGIAQNYAVNIDQTTYQPTIHFLALNADPAKKKAFYNLVMAELKAAVTKGLDHDLIESLLASFKFSKALGSEANNAINSLVLPCIYNNVLSDPMFNQNDAYLNVGKKVSDNYLEKMLHTYIIQNKTCALTVTTPKAGLLEKNQAALEKSLAKKKAAMSKQQIQSLVKETKAFQNWNSKKDSEELVQSLKAVSSKEIPVEVPAYQVKETKFDGMPLLSAETKLSGIGAPSFLFDESHLTKEELHYLNLYLNMIQTGIASEHKTKEELLNQTIQKTNGLSFMLTALANQDDPSKAHPIATISLQILNEDYPDVMKLLNEYTGPIDLTQNQTVLEQAITSLITNFKASFAEPLNLIILRSKAKTDMASRYANYFSGLDYYNFLQDTAKQMAADPQTVLTKLQAVSKKAFAKQNLTIAFAGDSASLQEFQNALPVFTDTLNKEVYTKATYDLPVPAKREALALNSTVQYIATNASFSDNGINKHGSYQVAATLLNNGYLIPELRLKGGAYGGGCGINTNNFMAYTFRDNDYYKSLNILSGMGNYLSQNVSLLSEQSLDSYIISTYAQYGASTGDLTSALTAINWKLSGWSRQDEIEYRNQIKSTTVDELKAFAPSLDTLDTNKNYIVAAPLDLINQHKELFDSVISLQ